MKKTVFFQRFHQQENSLKTQPSVKLNDGSVTTEEAIICEKSLPQYS